MIMKLEYTERHAWALTEILQYKRLSLADKHGFFAKLSEGINGLTDVIERVFKDIESSMESISAGDLTNRITSDYQGGYLTCKQDVNASIDRLSEIFTQVNASARFINSSSQEIASGNNNLSQRAEQQAANLEQTAASMEQLTYTVKINSENAQKANLVASNARELAENGGDVVTAAVAECSSFGKTIFEYHPGWRSAKDFELLVVDFLEGRVM